MNYLVTGGAGFIGSQLVDALLAEGHGVSVCDNFSTGHQDFLPGPVDCTDLSDTHDLRRLMQDKDIVFHFAAHADVRHGPDHPRLDLEQNLLGTYHVLEAMRQTGVRRLVFASTSAVYGEPNVFPTPENAPMPIQTSLYGASKLAAEGLIAAYCHAYGMQACIFRFASVLGERYSHGHVFDFYAQLKAHPDHLDILGDGNQRKSYVYVKDAVDAVMRVVGREGWFPEPVQIFNVGGDEPYSVAASAIRIARHLGLSPVLHFTDGPRGWVGDSPRVQLDCTKIKLLGWRTRVSVPEAIGRTLDYLKENEWLVNSTVK